MAPFEQPVCVLQKLALSLQPPQGENEILPMKWLVQVYPFDGPPRLIMLTLWCLRVRRRERMWRKWK
jgi:hypothetical protein